MSKLCRICLTENIEKDIFSLPYELNVQDTAYEVLKFCLDIELCEDTKQHSTLCNQCHTLIKQFYKLKLLALESEQHLKYIKTSTNDNENSFTVPIQSIILHDVVFKYEDEFKIEQSSFESGCDDQGREPSTDEENVEQFEDPEPDKTNKKIDRPKSKKQECEVCRKKYKYLKLHMIMHTRDSNQVSCKACKETFDNVTSLKLHYEDIHKDWVECKECNKYIQTTSLARHTKRYHRNFRPKTVSCEFCKKMVTNSDALERHLPKHLNEKRFYCNDCEKSFYGKLALELHIVAEIIMKERFFKCPDCDKTFQTKSHMRKHCLKHAPDFKRTKKMCPICGKSFNQLFEHMKRHLPAQSRQNKQCKVCKKKFVSSSYVKRHYNTVHLRMKFTCPICHKDVQRLGVHMKKEHSAKQFECEHCPKTFAMPFLLKQHLISHATERPFECQQCGSRFKVMENLQRHINTIHEGEKKFLCQICSKIFARKCNLDDHLISHSTERKFKCEVCKKMLKTADSLRVHMLRHEGVERHFCKICDKGFIVPGALQSHMLSHTKEKRYPCRVCDVRFGRSDHRARHERTAHLCHTDTEKQTSLVE